MHDVIEFLSSNDKLVTAWTAIAALIVSVISIVIAIVNMTMQRAHNRKSVLPIGHLSVEDYENRISVRLQNNGVGPMIIEKVTVTRVSDGGQAKSAVIDFMPELPSGYLWSAFVGDIAGRAITAEGNITLVALEGEQREKRFITARTMTREALSGLTIKVEYKNIYGESMPPASRSLSWFGRSL